MDGVQLSQGYRAIARRQFTFYHYSPRSSWYSLGQPSKKFRLNGSCQPSANLILGKVNNPLSTRLLCLNLKH